MIEYYFIISNLPSNNPCLTSTLVACWCRQFMAQTVTLRATALFVLMHSGIVNGYQLLCDAHIVLEPHRVNCSFFLFYSLWSFSNFSFYVFCHSWQSFSWVPLYFVLTIYRGQQIIFWFPDRTSICLYTPLAPQRLNDLNVFIALKALLN